MSQWYASISCAVVACGISLGAAAADRFFVYNMTTNTTFTGVYLAPPGSDKWGGNQALNDKDKSLDPSERLALKRIARGTFDVKLVDRKGRVCIRHGVDLSHDTTFDIRDDDLKDCH
jgi:hypothetical protein